MDPDADLTSLNHQFPHFEFKAALPHCRHKQQPAILFKLSKAWKSHKSNTKVFHAFQLSPFHHLNKFLKSAHFPSVTEGGQKPTEENIPTEQGAVRLKSGLLIYFKNTALPTCIFLIPQQTISILAATGQS